MSTSPQNTRKTRKGFIRPKTLLFFLSLFVAIPLVILAAIYPSWWTLRGVVDTNAIVTNDFAIANLGQLKWMATKAAVEFDASIPGGAVNYGLRYKAQNGEFVQVFNLGVPSFTPVPRKYWNGDQLY